VSFGEGGTPLVPLKEPNAFVKLEYVMPTGSFKDRGTTSLLSVVNPGLRKKNVRTIVEDSSGNAGASIAAYAAHAGLSCEIFAPAKVSEFKASQIRAYGARLHKIGGSREDVTAVTRKAAKRAYYASHVLSPFFSDGIRTLSYEIAEALDWEAPDYVFTPCSAGTLLLGLIQGFTHLRDSGTIERVPKVIAVQAEQVSPVFHKMIGRPYSPPRKLTTIADALISTKPPRLEEMFAQLNTISGECEAVSDKEIIEATVELARRGFFVEPSAAVGFAAWKSRRLAADRKVVVVLTGSGLKKPITSPK
ncbi:MAG: pyridoxal-phosphate dependent enzyme, partial [Candidatus Bathyarchaeia archaeon]